MGFFNAFDFTNPSAPLGGLVRQGLTALPGGQTAVGAVDAYNAARRTNRDVPTDRGAPPAAAPSSGRPWYARAGTIVGAGAAVLVLVVALVLVRRK